MFGSSAKKARSNSPNDYGAEYILIGGEKKDVDFKRSPGHFKEFATQLKQAIQAWHGQTSKTMLENSPKSSLLGNLAVWAAGKSVEGKATVESPRLEWDQANLKVKGTNELT